jgi:hypothetical protein
MNFEYAVIDTVERGGTYADAQQLLVRMTEWMPPDERIHVGDDVNVWAEALVAKIASKWMLPDFGALPPGAARGPIDLPVVAPIGDASQFALAGLNVGDQVYVVYEHERSEEYGVFGVRVESADGKVIGHITHSKIQDVAAVLRALGKPVSADVVEITKDSAGRLRVEIRFPRPHLHHPVPCALCGAPCTGEYYDNEKLVCFNCVMRLTNDTDNDWGDDSDDDF